MLLRPVFVLLVFFSFSVNAGAQNFDVRLLRSINQSVHPNLNTSMRIVSGSVAPMIIAVPAGLLVYEHYRKDGDIRKPFVIGAAVAGAGAISFALKYSIKRPRPFVTYPYITQYDPNVGPLSFPSAHTAFAFSLATSVSLEYPEWYVIAPAFAWAGTVAYSRMRLGVHYPSDVAGGILIGGGCAVACHYINKKLVERSKKEREMNSTSRY